METVCTVIGIGVLSAFGLLLVAAAVDKLMSMSLSRRTQVGREIVTARIISECCALSRQLPDCTVALLVAERMQAAARNAAGWDQPPLLGDAEFYALVRAASRPASLEALQ